MALERDMLADPTPEQRESILKRLGAIEESVNTIKTPLSFADQLYVLREHISWVQHRLLTSTGKQEATEQSSSYWPRK